MTDDEREEWAAMIYRLEIERDGLIDATMERDAEIEALRRLAWDSAVIAQRGGIWEAHVADLAAKVALLESEVSDRNRWWLERGDETARTITALEQERDALREKWRKADLALQSLTAQGSEFVNDPERCVAYVREVQSSQHRVICSTMDRLKKAEQERDALRQAGSLTSLRSLP